MKRIIFVLSVLIMAAALSFPAVMTGGLGFGLGTVSDGDLSDAYGSGFVFSPYLSYGITDCIAVGIGYEGGYKKDGTVGMFEDHAELKISGFSIFAEYRFKSRKLTPYLKLGYGYYTVSNQFEDDGMKKYGFSEKGSGAVLGGGVRYPLGGNLLITGGLEYLMLSVKPFDESVNSGGLRLLAGFALKFDI